MKLEQEITFRSTFKLALPMVLSGFAVGLINFMDTVFLGHLSEVALNISNIGGLIYFICFMVSHGLGMGLQIVVSRSAGENNHEEVVKGFQTGLSIALITGSIVTLIAYVLIPALLPIAIDDSGTAEGTISYLDWRLWSILPAFLSGAFRAFLTSTGLNRAVAWAAFMMAFINILLNYLLIFGNQGFPGMGVSGAGLASGIAEFSGFVFLLVYILKSVKKEFPEILSTLRMNASIRRKISQISVPLILQFIVSNLIWLVFFALITNLGQREGAISNLMKTLFMFYMIPVWGFVQAVNSITSNIIGQGRSNDVYKYALRSGMQIAAGMSIVALFHFLFTEQILWLFTDNVDLQQEAFPIVRMLSLFIIVASFFSLLFNAYTGTGNTKIAVWFELTGAFLYLIFVVYFIKVQWVSLAFVWSSEILYWFVLGGLSWYGLRKGLWKKSLLSK